MVKLGTNLYSISIKNIFLESCLVNNIWYQYFNLFIHFLSYIILYRYFSYEHFYVIYCKFWSTKRTLSDMVTMRLPTGLLIEYSLRFVSVGCCFRPIYLLFKEEKYSSIECLQLLSHSLWFYYFVVLFSWRHENSCFLFL